MKTIIAGSRDITDYNLLLEAIKYSRIPITTVVSGCAKGVDKLGEQYANDNNIPIEPCPADWKTFGNNAGPIRNKKMAENSEALIAVWDGVSGGTKNMIDTAEKLGLMVYVLNLKKRNYCGIK